MLIDLQPPTRQQLTLDLDADMPEKRIRLMQAVDQINRRFGRGSLQLGSAGGSRKLPIGDASESSCRRGFATDWAGLAVAG
jgi:DNA polymerase V